MSGMLPFAVRRMYKNRAETRSRIVIVYSWVAALHNFAHVKEHAKIAHGQLVDTPRRESPAPVDHLIGADVSAQLVTVITNMTKVRACSMVLLQQSIRSWFLSLNRASPLWNALQRTQLLRNNQEQVRQEVYLARLSIMPLQQQTP